MGIGNDGLQAEAERDAHNEAVETLRQLLLWSDTTGGWESAAWERARAVVAKADAAKGAHGTPDALWTCPSCGEASTPREVNTTWQQWQYACCGSWNVLAETR